MAFVGWSAVSAAWAEIPGESLDTAIRYLPNAFLFLIVFSAVRTREQALLIVGAFVAGALVSALYGLAVPVDPAEGDRLSGGAGNANETAAALVSGAALAAGLALAARDNILVRGGRGRDRPPVRVRRVPDPVARRAGGAGGRGGGHGGRGWPLALGHHRLPARSDGLHAGLLQCVRRPRGARAGDHLRGRHRQDRRVDRGLEDGGGRAGARHRVGQLPQHLGPLPAGARRADPHATSSSTPPRWRTTCTWRCWPSSG